MWYNSKKYFYLAYFIYYGIHYYTLLKSYESLLVTVLINYLQFLSAIFANYKINYLINVGLGHMSRNLLVSVMKNRLQNNFSNSTKV